MHRVDGPDAVQARPEAAPPASLPGFFQGGNPSIGQRATRVPAHWLNTVQEEIANVVEAAGLSLDRTKSDQLLAAIRAIVEKTSGPGKHIGEPFFHPSVQEPVGSIRARGELFPRGLYLGLWAWVMTENDLRVSLGLPPLLVDEATWQSTAASQDGYCQLYSTGDGSTTFRAPFYGRFFGAATSDAEINKWQNDQIVNITGRLGGTHADNAAINDANSALYWLGFEAQRSTAANATGSFGFTASIDASRVVRTGSEVTPKACLLPIYIHAYNAVINQAAVDMQGWLNALNGKLDKVDFSGFPSDTYIDIPWGASGMTYTVPADGWVVANRNSTTNNPTWLSISSSAGMYDKNFVSVGPQAMPVNIEVSKGDIVTISWASNGGDSTPVALRFIAARLAPGL